MWRPLLVFLLMAIEGSLATSIQSWTSATRQNYIAGAAGGDLVVSFTPTSSVSTGQQIILTPSYNIWTSNAPISCSLTSNALTVVVSGSGITGSVLTVTLGTTMGGGSPAVLTCTDNLATNPVGGTVITFDIETTTDTTPLTGQTGYTTQAPTLTTNVLYLGTPVSDSPTSMTYQFALNTPLAIGDSIQLTLPNFALSSFGSINFAGCGSTTFTFGSTGSTTAAAAVTMTAADAVLNSGTTCSVSIGSGVTCSHLAQSANDNSRTVFVNLAASDNVNTAITTSPALPLAITHSELEFGSSATDTAASITFKFKINEPMQQGSGLAIALPGFQWAGTPATSSSGGCSGVSWSAFAISSGTGSAQLVISTTAGDVTPGQICTLTISSGVTTAIVAQVANLNTRTVAFSPLVGASGTIGSTAIPISPELLTRYLSTELVLNPGITATAASFAFTFKLNTPMATGDTHAVVVPGFSFASLVIPITSGCGSTTFSVSDSNSGTSTATLTFTAGSAPLAAASTCTITVTNGVTTSVVSQVANAPSRTTAATLAGQTDIGITSIATSTVLPTRFITNSLTVATPITDTATSISVGFVLNADVEIGDTIDVYLPSWSSGTFNHISTIGCGTTTFTASGTGSLTVTLTAGSATLGAGIGCTVVIGSGLTSSVMAQVANMATRTIAATLANSDNVSPVTIQTSTKLPAKMISSGLTFTNPVTAAPTGLSMTFTLNIDLEVNDRVVFLMPWISFNSYGSGSIPTTSGCGTTTFTVQSADDPSGEEATLVFIAGGATLPEVTTCTLTFASGLTTPINNPPAQPANWADRKFRAFLANADDIAWIPITTSDAIDDPAMLVSNFFVDNAVTAAPSLVTYTFKCNAPIDIGDTISLVIPAFHIPYGTTIAFSTPTFSGGCGSTTFTVATSNPGTSTFTLVFTSADAQYPAHQTCTITIATGIRTSEAPQSINFSERKVSAILANADDIPSTTILTSTAIAHSLVTSSQLVIATPTTTTATAITLTFTLDSKLYTHDAIHLVLPDATFGTLVLGANVGCGDAVFSATSSGDGTDLAEVVFNATSGSFARATSCAISLTSGVVNGRRARATNFAGRLISLTMTFTTDIAPTPVALSTSLTDVTPPQLNASNSLPAIGYPNSTFTGDIVIAFDELVQGGTGLIQLVPISGDTIAIPAADGQVSFSGKVMTINPTLNLSTYGTDYDILWPNTAVKDAYNNYHAGFSAGDYTFGVADTEAPVLLSISPAHEATGVPYTSQYELTFSEDVMHGVYPQQGGIIFTPSHGEAVTQPSPVVASGAMLDTSVSNKLTISITPGNPLTQIGVEYTVTMLSGVIHDASMWRVKYPGMASAGNPLPQVCTAIYDGKYSVSVSQSRLLSTGTGTETYLIVTMGGTCPAGVPITITCSEDLDRNKGPGVVTFGIETSEDTTLLTGQTGYTITPSPSPPYGPGSVFWRYGTRASSNVAGQAGGNLEVAFTPQATIPITGTITITPSVNIFSADASITCTATSEGYSKTVTSAATVGAVLTVTMGGPLYGGVEAVITCTNNMVVNPAPVSITFSIVTSTDTLALTGQTGYSTVAQNKITWISAERTNSLASGLHPEYLTVKFKLNTAIPIGGTIVLQGSVNLFMTSAAILCSLRANGILQTLTSSVADTVSRRVTLTTAVGLKTGPEYVMYCVDNLASNGGTGAVTFDIESSTDTVAAANLVGYTITPANRVTWVRATRTVSYMAGVQGGDVVIKFIPTTGVSVGGALSVVSSPNIFSGDALIDCGVTVKVGNSEGNKKTIAQAIVSGGVLVIGMTMGLIGNEEVTITCRDNLADNVAGPVTFTVQTSSDQDPVINQVGYTVVTTPQVYWGGASRSISYTAGKQGGDLSFTFTPQKALSSGSTVTLRPSRNIFKADVFRYIVPDTAGPTVGNYSPLQGSTNHQIGQNIVITFGENIQAGTGSFTLTPSSTTKYHVRVGTGNVYYIDTFIQKSLTFKVGNRYSFNLDHYTNGNGVFAYPLVLSTTSDGTHNGGSVLTNADVSAGGYIEYKLNGGVVTQAEWCQIGTFAAASTRQITIQPNTATTYYYYSCQHANTGGQITVGPMTYSPVVIPAAPSAQVDYTAKVLTLNPTADFLDDSASDRATQVKYILTAPSGIITDALGNVYLGLTGDTYSFTIDHTSPVVNATNPPSHSLQINKRTSIVITFDEPVQAGVGNVLLEPYPGVANGAIPVTMDVSHTNISFSGADMTILPPDPLINGNTYFVTMAYGVVKDASNNPFLGLFTTGHVDSMYYFSIADVGLPVVSTYSPAQGANAALTQDIVLTFNENVQAGSGNIVIDRFVGQQSDPTGSGLIPAETLTIDVQDKYQVRVANLIMTINPHFIFQYDNTYRLTMSAAVVRDDKPSSNPFPGLSGNDYLFHVVPDTSPSLVIGFNPVNNAFGVPSNSNIILTFNENVTEMPVTGFYNNISAGYVYFNGDNGHNVGVDVNDASQVSFSGPYMTINPTNDLTSGITYTVTLASGAVQDIYGNVFAGITSGTYKFHVSNICTYTFTGYSCDGTQCVVTYVPNDVFCGDLSSLSYIASIVASPKLANITADAATQGKNISVVQTYPLGLRVGVGSGLIWPEYIDPLA